LNISPSGKVVAALSTLGILWAGFKNIREITAVLSSLNGWAVLAILCLLGFCYLAIDWYHNWLRDRFARLEAKLQADTKELSTAISGVSTQCDTRIGNIDQQFESRLKKEIDSRVAGEISDRSRISEMENKLARIESWFKEKQVNL